MNALSTVAIMPTTKAEIVTFVKGAKEEILSGNYNPIDIEIQLKAMEEMIKALRSDKEIKEYLADELARNGGKYESSKATISTRNSTRYDYSNDSVWSEIKVHEDEVSEERKKREKMLQNLTEEMADPQTGEIIYPAVKVSQTSIVVTLK